MESCYQFSPGGHQQIVLSSSLVVICQNDGLLGKFFTKPYVVSKEAHACALWHGEKSSSILPGEKVIDSLAKEPFSVFLDECDGAPLGGYRRMPVLSPACVRT